MTNEFHDEWMRLRRRVRQLCCSGICAAGFSFVHAAAAYAITYIEPAARAYDAEDAISTPGGGVRKRDIAPDGAGDFPSPIQAQVSASSAADSLAGGADPESDSRMTINGVEFSVESSSEKLYVTLFAGLPSLDWRRMEFFVDDVEDVESSSMAGHRSSKGRPLRPTAMSTLEEDPIPVSVRMLYSRYSAGLQSAGLTGDSHAGGGAASSSTSPDMHGAESIDPKTSARFFFRFFRFFQTFWSSMDPLVLTILGILALPVAITAPILVLGRRGRR